MSKRLRIIQEVGSMMKNCFESIKKSKKTKSSIMMKYFVIGNSWESKKTEWILKNFNEIIV
jgi:hypothetical protein